MTVTRHSSRRQRLDESFLREHLANARSYWRIAGYFTSSLFEVADELVDQIPDVRIVCNATLSEKDLRACDNPGEAPPRQVQKLREQNLLAQWAQGDRVGVDAVANRDRYVRMRDFLGGRTEAIRFVPDGVCGFVHGKAGLIERTDGRSVAFIGSMNATREGWQKHYELLWEDDDPNAVAWVREEFEFLWRRGYPLTDGLVREMDRRANRTEVDLNELTDRTEIAPAAFAEAPLTQDGGVLEPWQQGFVSEAAKHRKAHGQVRLLLADQVGLGKTLSLGTALTTLCLWDDIEREEAGRPRIKPAVVFAPARLCPQWQTEMEDKLGIPCALWSSRQKVWLDARERRISASGPQEIQKCPTRIGIVSTGLLGGDSVELGILKSMRFTAIVLDESHKARTQRSGVTERQNNLLVAIRDLAHQSDHVLLGTATPVQTHLEELWDQMSILSANAPFVLGSENSPWRKPDRALPLLKGEEVPTDLQDSGEAWNWLRDPLPLTDLLKEGQTRRYIYQVRIDLGLEASDYRTSQPVVQLDEDLREDLGDALDETVQGATFFQRNNPIVRHTVMRRRDKLEEKGLLRPIAATIHPDPERVDDVDGYRGLFEGQALRTDEAFDRAYEAAEAFIDLIAERRDRGGTAFMKNMMRQRVTSSIQSGLLTARRIRRGEDPGFEDPDTEQGAEITTYDAWTDRERQRLDEVIAQLEQAQTVEDPKLKAVRHYLFEERWLESHGCIVFSQYYDTARWIADRLAETIPETAIGLYAGAGKSRYYRNGTSTSADRETLKDDVKKHRIPLMIATDAACEGLNLQTLGTMINVDLPWNPTKLEQRIGRIKRFGQVRSTVDVLNLVYQGTTDETVYMRLSERMKDAYDLFGNLPDTIRDEWIEEEERLGDILDRYIKDHRQATGFELAYNDTVEPSERDWHECSRIIASADLSERMWCGW